MDRPLSFFKIDKQDGSETEMKRHDFIRRYEKSFGCCFPEDAFLRMRDEKLKKPVIETSPLIWWYQSSFEIYEIRA